MNRTKLTNYFLETLLSNIEYDNIGKVNLIDRDGFEIETILNGFVTTFYVKIDVEQYEVFGDEGDEE